MADLFSGTSAQITPFNFNSHAVRVVMRDGEPWFICADVAQVLGYRDASNAGRVLDDDEKGTHNLSTPGGDQRVTIISESGLYALVLRSRKPEARKFAKWVTSEVLPAIRKTGKYEQPQPAVALRGRYTPEPEPTIRGRRFLVSIDGNLRETITAVPSDAYVLNTQELAGMIAATGNGLYFSDVELANVAAACHQRLAERLANQTRGLALRAKADMA